MNLFVFFDRFVAICDDAGIIILFYFYFNEFQLKSCTFLLWPVFFSSNIMSLELLTHTIIQIRYHGGNTQEASYSW